MSDLFYRGLLSPAGGGGGGGGGCSGIAGATIYDDDFSCPAVDTAGTRFPGANPWTIFNPNSGHVVNASATQSGGELILNSGNGTTDPDPHGIWQTLPSGNWKFRTKMRSTVSQSFWSLSGIILYEAATNKNLLCFMGYDLNYRASVWAQSGLQHSHTNTYGGTVYAADTANYWLEVERNGSTLTYRATDDATDGNDLTTSLGTTPIMSVSQTVDFTTGPDRIGLFVTGNVYITAFDWFKKL